MTYDPDGEYEIVDFSNLSKYGRNQLSINIKNMNNKFEFLTSVRFWQLFLVGVAVGLNFPFPNNPWVQGFSAMIGIWFGGGVFMATTDKSAQKEVEAAKINQGMTPEQAKVV